MSDDRTDAREQSHVAVALGDSLYWSTESDDGFHFPILVGHGSRLDTIPDVRSSVLPVLVGDSMILGFHEERGRLQWSFRYDVASQRLDTIPLLPDLYPLFAQPAFSPDGLHIAYVVSTGDGTAAAMVRTWPAGERIYRGPAIAIPASDFLLNGSRWLGAEEFEVLIDLGGFWHRDRGSVRSRMAVADTVH